MTFVLGIDPGPSKCAWALLDISGRGKAPVICCGLVDTPALDLGAWADPATLLAIEWPAFRPIGGRANPAQSLAMAAALVETALVAGELAGRAHGQFAGVVRVTCGQVRKALIGRPSCTDAELAWAIAFFVELPKRSNAHVRDAMAAAVVGWRVWHAMDGAQGALPVAQERA